MKKAIISLIGGAVVFVIALLVFQGLSTTSQARITKSEAEQLATQQFPGQVIAIEFDDGRYEVEIANEDIHYELDLDAVTGEILKLEEKQAGLPNNSNQQEDNQVVDDNTLASGELITIERAMEIALEQVTDGVIIELSLDSDDGQRYYEIELETSDQEIELDIDAYTGEVLVISYDRHDFTAKWQANMLPIAEAIKLALDDEMDGTLKQIKLEQENQKAIYEVELISNNQEIELELDAFTGQISKREFDTLD
ncbi:Uncharacterized membrane protein YkoI [Amphibacillus marinus]|uniref:Uncharacterized membrane protein YkoI n=1 Tax=Amphibacillus marinus TaxID=872970 RepID=A0A1H8IHT5_9BACI|nr:PepSY domain-containing protein [Amphibacillus marinus]SEN67825.1 Uncharacterized membrane protein YkoI [Amphibacillus marinus]